MLDVLNVLNVKVYGLMVCIGSYVMCNSILVMYPPGSNPEEDTDVSKIWRIKFNVNVLNVLKMDPSMACWALLSDYSVPRRNRSTKEAQKRIYI